jgi:hypothetical protein
MKPTNILDPNYFHKVVDCQWACPAHTPVPEYIRLIAQERYTEAYMLNWDSNVFPGILGRTCDRPCEPACRRVRTEEKPVAICRLKRAAADLKGDITPYLPRVPTQKNGKRIAIVGAGPASLAVARDLLPQGYDVHMFERDPYGGGMMRSQIPAFRLPESVLDDEVKSGRTGEQSQTLRIYLCRALGEFTTPAAAAPLVRLASGEGDPQVVRAAVEGLALLASNMGSCEIAWRTK